MGNTKGYSEYLRAFARQITTGIWLTGLDIIGPGSEINLRGRALQAEALPAYINRLKSEPVMLGKTFSMLEMQVPSVDTEIKDDKGSKVMKSGLASFIEFSLQTKVTEVDPNEASPMESTKPNSMQLPGLFKDAGKSGGMLAK